MTYRDEVLADSPIAYWRLGESSGSTAVDETANGHDGTYQGDPTLGAAGALTNDDDTAVYMDGAGDAVDLGDTIDPQTGSFTVEAWIKVDDVSIQGQRIQVKQDGIDGWAFSLGDPGSGAIRFFIRESATIVSLDTATGVVSNGVWHHVVGVYDASAGTRKIYVDAVEEASAADDTGGFPTNTADYVLSAQRVDGNISKELAGVADEFAVYPSALSSSRIEYHYNYGVTGSKYATEVLMDDPTAYWRLGESSGTTAVDETANGHDGTYQGDPTLGVAGAIETDDDTAVDFDGSNDYVPVDHFYSTQGGVAAVTLEAWVKTTSTNEMIIVGYDANEYFRLDQNGFSDSGLGFHTTDSGATIHNMHGSSVNDGAWHHLVAVYDGTDKVIYIDGQEDARASNPHGGAALGSGTTRYGFIADDSEATSFDGAQNQAFFTGVIDEVAVYESGLSSTRVQAHYDAAQSTTVDVVTFIAHSVLLKHRPQFEGRFSPHVVVLNHFKAVPLQPHIVNLLHRGNVLKGDDSEQGQATALRKLLGYGWGVPDPAGSANEKIETPRESWPIHRFHEAERLLRQEGVEEPTAQALGDALRRLGEDIHLDVKENLQRYEWHANAHTHSGLAGAEGTPVGPAEALFTVGGGGTLYRRLTSDGSVFWSRGDNYGDLAVDPVERRVYAIGISDTDTQYVDRVVSYDFDGVEQWNIDLHARIGDASETVRFFTLARDRSALYTIYNDGSQFGVVNIDVQDGSVSVIGKDTPSSTSFYPTATFDTDGDYLYFSDRAFHGGNRGRIIKFSLGDGHIVWEMSPDLANQHDCPLCATDTLLWAQKENGKVILVDKASGGVSSTVDLSGKDGARGGNLWKDFHNTNSLYVLGTNFTVPDTWLYRLYTLGGTIQTEELAFFEDLDMGRVVRDGEGNFFFGGGSGFDSHLMKLSPDLEVEWRIDGPSPYNFCTDQGRSVHWG